MGSLPPSQTPTPPVFRLLSALLHGIISNGVKYVVYCQRFRLFKRSYRY